MNRVQHIAIVLGSLRTGGAERAALHLANEFAQRGLRTDLVLVNAEGEFLSLVHPAVRLVDLHSDRTRFAAPALRQYLEKNTPQVLLVLQTHVQILVLRTLRKMRKDIPVILNEHSTFSKNIKGFSVKNFVQRALAAASFRRAAAVITVSQGTAKDFSGNFPSLKKRIHVINNPVLTKEFEVRTKEPCEHPFFRDSSIPVVVSAGRLVASKDYRTLLEAVSLVRKEKRVRLIVLGEGEERSKLLQYAERLDMKDDFSLPGYVSNPLAYMSAAALFAMSSTHEGLPFVLVEALACGCPIVSTDCPSGPSEILLEGKLGLLVPLKDPERMAAALLASLAAPGDAGLRISRAREFTVEKSASAYLDVMTSILNDQ